MTNYKQLSLLELAENARQESQQEVQVQEDSLLDRIYEYVDTLQLDECDEDILATELLMSEDVLLAEGKTLDKIKKVAKSVVASGDKLATYAAATGAGALAGAGAVAHMGKEGTRTVAKALGGDSAKKLAGWELGAVGKYATILGAAIVGWGAYRIYDWINSSKRQIKNLKTKTIPDLKIDIKHAGSSETKGKYNAKLEKAENRLKELEKKIPAAKKVADIKKKKEEAKK